MKTQNGQIILLLVLIMTVGLAIGISVVQRSVSDISTATKVEQSQRALSAAEAGIEKALQGNVNPVDFSSENNSTATIDPGSSTIFPAPQSGLIRQDPLEYDPPLAREEVAQVWLADLWSSSSPPAAFYKPPPSPSQPTIDVYWGNSASDRAALSLTLVFYGKDPTDPEPGQRNVNKYRSKKWFLDQYDRSNGFDFPEKSASSPTCPGGIVITYLDGSLSNTYRCRKTVDFSDIFSGDRDAILMLLRARLLYNNTSQPFAVQAVGTCGDSCSLPRQYKKIKSTGLSGQTQRKILLFQEMKVVPPYFDYAIFSVGDINK